MDRQIGGMTLRELTGLGLLVILLLGGLLSSWDMSRRHGEIARTLEACTWQALSGQWENARNTAETAEQAWQQGRGRRAAVSDHTPLEEIDSLFAELGAYAAAGDRTGFARTCAALSRHMDALGDAHRVSWQNIF